MKTKKRIAVIVVLLFSLFLPFLAVRTNVSLTAYLQAFFGTKQTPSSEDDLKNKYASMSTKELLNQLNGLGRESNDFLDLASELHSRSNDISDTQLLEWLDASDIQAPVKELLLEISAAQYFETGKNPVFRALLSDPKTEYFLKVKAVALENFTQSDIAMLKEYIKNDSGLLGFQSMKQLARLDTQQAFELAAPILSEPKGKSDYQLSAALKAASKHLKKTGSDAEIDQFIKTALDLLSSSEHTETLHDSAVFALSDLLNERALKALLQSDAVDVKLKAFVVDQNYATLDAMLDSGVPKEDDVLLVMEAMGIYPIKEIGAKLAKAAAIFNDPEQAKQCKQLAESIAENGANANPKWQD